jgi:hypothetical protein
MEAAMNFCGACGALLDAGDRARGVCPACGAPLDSDPSSGFTTAPVSRPAPSWGGAPFARTAARPGWGWFALLGVAALLVLGVGLALLFAIHGLWGPAGRPPTAHGAGSGSGAGSTQTTAVSPAIPSASPTVSSRGAPTGTPGSGPGPTATPTPSPSPSPVITITATALPVLSVNPTQINAGICATKSEQFTVSNSGGGSFTWSASASNLAYGVSPASGTLSSGQQTTVTVTDIVKSGSVNVEAPGVQGSPQTVSITCTGVV